MIRALILDFDGLILDTETALIEAYGDVYAAHGIIFDRAIFAASVGHADYAFDPWSPFGPKADQESLEAQRRAFNRSRNDLQPVLPGVSALVAEATRSGLRLGMASNSTHDHVDGHLARLGLLASFDFVACREDVPAPKPAPDLYRLVLNTFDLPGEAAIAFEDSHTGIVSAKRAGLWVVAIPNPSTGHHDLSGADLRLASLAETRLADLLARFGS
ncbi:MAG TPA: HAD-IA family hydrolase [Opitutaceae bacterium]|jgi:putative hydrolase of the HAD superfamily